MNYEDDYLKKVNYQIWKKILKVVFKEKKTAILLVVVVVFTGILDISIPLFGAYAIDTYFDKKIFTTLPLYITLLFISAFLLGLSVWAFISLATKIEVETNYQLRKKAFENLQKLSLDYYDKTPQGWIMARMTSDSRRLAEIISWGLVDVFWSLALMLTILVILFIFNVKLALIIFISLPLMMVIAYFFRKKILKYFRKARKLNSEVTRAFNESFLAANTSKSLAIETRLSKDFGSQTQNLKEKTIKAVVWSSLFTPLVLMISYFVLALVMYQGSKMVLNITVGALTIGTFYLFVDYTTSFFNPINNIARILAQLQQAQAAAERIIELIEKDTTVKDSKEVILKYGNKEQPNYANWEPIIGKIEFLNVDFYYQEKEIILKNFNLTINPGTRVALVGPTGGGKTSIANLIMRFYQPVRGKILIDDVDYQKRSIHWLRSNIGYVLQTPYLFTGTIFDNIRYGNLSVTEDEVKSAAKLVGADQFIRNLPLGYQSEVGESGNKLSLGEKQLISFARALIVNPKIFILDEATSSIDSAKEKEIIFAIDQLLKTRTSIIIAHRLSTIVESDLIIYIDQGKIIESGNHQTLINNRGPYFDLYKTQFFATKEEQLKDLI